MFVAEKRKEVASDIIADLFEIQHGEAVMTSGDCSRRLRGGGFCDRLWQDAKLVTVKTAFVHNEFDHGCRDNLTMVRDLRDRSIVKRIH